MLGALSLAAAESDLSASASCHKLLRADLSGEPMPRWAGQADAATTAYRTGTDTAADPKVSN